MTRKYDATHMYNLIQLIAPHFGPGWSHKSLLTGLPLQIYGKSSFYRSLAILLIIFFVFSENE